MVLNLQWRNTKATPWPILTGSTTVLKTVTNILNRGHITHCKVRDIITMTQRRSATVARKKSPSSRCWELIGKKVLKIPTGLRTTGQHYIRTSQDALD